MAAPVLLPAAAPEKLGHKKYRAILKKEKRKKKRQALARLRDSVIEAQEKKLYVEGRVTFSSEVTEKDEPLSEEEELEEEEKQLEAERQKLHEEWLLREEKAQEDFKVKKEKEEAIRKLQEEEERKIKEEWEEQQRKEREEEEQKQQEKREREEAVQKMLDQAESQLENGTTWHNPEPPENIGTEKDRANCPFYIKTGSCRFGDRCSRKHNYPTSSQTLLIRGMFVTFGMEQCRRDDYDTDASLEYSEEETYQQFLDFYEDVLPEFKNVGKVIQFKVSCNYEPHLRGNVYVQYQLERDCQEALALFNGRWYAGRQLQCEFCPVTRWKTAICGLFERQKCPRGKHCNFLHVFRNPHNEFWEANRDIHISPERTSQSAKNSERRNRSGHHEDYYSKSRRRTSPSSDHSYKRNGESDRKKSSHKSKKRRQSGRSRSRERRRSHSRGKKRRGRSRSRSHSCTRGHSRSRSSSRSRSRGKKRSDSRGRSNDLPPKK
ncbi:U2 small nuclear ribonucleoprotein auxiliary factor 35 kDa subunit-related protein 2 isoform X1 [Pelodiscus sinensis]|uniref:U2 small nuclear ribonucleoprotein auxiliary factor 35 kDa subunit-related protein 2 isoform X1 n=1 Tax=Pelodiscus sinensis TaxID=13735 RepID=UPI003F6C18F9